MPKKVQTIVVSNFGGRLTRIINGDLNSGFAKFDTSFGYDPFTKPGNLTWFVQPQSIAGINQIVVGGINAPTVALSPVFSTGKSYVIAVGSEGRLYKILSSAPFSATPIGGPLIDSVVAISSVQSAFSFSAGMQFFGKQNKLFLGGDFQIISTGSVEAVTGEFFFNGASSTLGNTEFMTVGPHPLQKFSGKLHFGNGPTIGTIDSSETIVSSIFTINSVQGNQYSQLFPPLPQDQYVRDLDVTVDNNYLQMSASSAPIGFVSLGAATNPEANVNGGEGGVYSWNGIDQGVTAATTIPGGFVSALQTYYQKQMIFSADTFGATIGDVNQKQLSLPFNQSPHPNATGSNGNFLTWANAETTGFDGSNFEDRVASLYYFGSLDQENPEGLYRLVRWSTSLENGFVYQVPYNGVVGAAAQSTRNASVMALRIVSYGKHYFSTYNASSLINASSQAGVATLNSFVVSSSNIFAPQLGVYETQTQMFSKRVTVKQIRVYTESTVSGNGFQLDIIGADGDSLQTFTYSFVAGSDITALKGSLQRINFNPTAEIGYGIGIRITNTGTTNMTIKKAEIDWDEEGK